MRSINLDILKTKETMIEIVNNVPQFFFWTRTRSSTRSGTNFISASSETRTRASSSTWTARRSGHSCCSCRSDRSTWTGGSSSPRHKDVAADPSWLVNAVIYLNNPDSVFLLFVTKRSDEVIFYRFFFSFCDHSSLWFKRGIKPDLSRL
jgi:hypothetical protein